MTDQPRLQAFRPSNAEIWHVLERKIFTKYRAGAVAVCGSTSLRPTFSVRQQPTCPKCRQILLERQHGE